MPIRAHPCWRRPPRANPVPPLLAAGASHSCWRRGVPCVLLCDRVVWIYGVSPDALTAPQALVFRTGSARCFQPSYTALKDVKFLFLKTHAEVAKERKRIADDVFAWAETQSQFKCSQAFFPAKTFALIMVDGFMSTPRKPISGVKTCTPRHVSMNKTIMEEMLHRVDKVDSRKDDAEVGWGGGQLDTCAKRQKLDTSFVRSAVSTTTNATILEILPEPRKSSMPTHDQFFGRVAPIFTTATPGFEAFYDGKDVEAPHMPVSMEFLLSTTQQAYKAPCNIAMGIGIEAARHFLLGTVVILENDEEMMNAVVDLGITFQECVPIYTFSLGQGPDTTAEELVAQRVGARKTLADCGVVVCLRDKSVLQELIGTLSEIKNDKTSRLGHMIEFRKERQIDHVEYKIHQSMLKYADFRKQEIIKETRLTASLRLAHNYTLKSAKLAPLSDKMRLDNMTRADVNVRKSPSNYFTVDADKLVTLRGTIWNCNDTFQSAKERASLSALTLRTRVKMQALNKKWSTVDNMTSPISLGFFLITSSRFETEEEMAKDSAKQVAKLMVREAEKKKQEEAAVEAERLGLVTVETTPVETTPVEKQKAPSPTRAERDVRKLMRSLMGFEINPKKKIDTPVPLSVLNLYRNASRCIWKPNGPETYNVVSESLVTDVRVFDHTVVDIP